MTAELLVVHLKVRHCAAGLTPPAVATQDLLAQTFVRQGIQPLASGFWPNHSHDAFSRMLSRKLCWCSPGKKRKNRVIENNNISGFGSPRLAPASGLISIDIRRMFAYYRCVPEVLPCSICILPLSVLGDQCSHHVWRQFLNGAGY